PQLRRPPRPCVRRRPARRRRAPVLHQLLRAGFLRPHRELVHPRRLRGGFAAHIAANSPRDRETTRDNWHMSTRVSSSRLIGRAAELAAPDTAHAHPPPHIAA